MKAFFIFLILLVLLAVDYVLVVLLWLPVRLIFGVNTARYVFSSEVSLGFWLQEQTKPKTNE